MIRGIHHVGVAVAGPDAARRVYEDLLGLRLESTDEVPSQRVRAAFYPCRDVRLELLESTDPEGPVGRFLARRGEGLHHVAFEVDDIRAELARARGQGFQLLDAEPRPGAHGNLVAFLHPKSTHGVLVEFVQPVRE